MVLRLAGTMVLAEETCEGMGLQLGVVAVGAQLSEWMKF